MSFEVRLWSAVASEARHRFGFLAKVGQCLKKSKSSSSFDWNVIQSGVALRLPPHSKNETHEQRKPIGS